MKAHRETPWQKLKKEKPDLKGLRIFGSLCYVPVPEQHRNKLDPRTRTAVLLSNGLPKVTRVYLDSRVQEVREVLTDKTKRGWTDHEEDVSSEVLTSWFEYTLSRSATSAQVEPSVGTAPTTPAHGTEVEPAPVVQGNTSSVTSEDPSTDFEDAAGNSDSEGDPEGSNQPAVPVLGSGDSPEAEGDAEPTDDPKGDDGAVPSTHDPSHGSVGVDAATAADLTGNGTAPASVGATPQVQSSHGAPTGQGNVPHVSAPDAATAPRRSGRTKKAPDFYTPETFVATSVMEPTTLKQAQESPQWSEWKEAMHEEYNTLIERGTWTLVEPTNEQPILPCKWVYKVKTRQDGSIERYKARLVAGGHRQVEGIDYDLVFAPVSRWTTLRLLLAKVATEGLHMSSIDVSNAFLYGDLKETVHMKQPALFDDGSGRVCKLHKSLYGLKQAPREWYNKLKECLQELGFTPSMDDQALWTRHGKNGQPNVYGVSWVDNLLLVCKDQKVLEVVKKAILTKFKGRDLGTPSSYLNARLHHDMDKGTLLLCQDKLIAELGAKYGINPTKKKGTPIAAGAVVEGRREEEEDVKGQVPYAELVGALLYVANVSRPDIACATSIVARYTSSPAQRHWVLVKGILQYLVNTKHLGLCYKRGAPCLEAYVDSDYATCRDTRRSRTGFLFTCGGAPVSWQSTLQKIVANSTAESEYVAASKAVKEAVWIGRLAFDLGLRPKGPVVLKVDNQAAIAIAKDNTMSARTKHIDIAYHFVRSCVVNNQVSLVYVSTKENLADILTKVVTSDTFGYLRGKMVVC